MPVPQPDEPRTETTLTTRIRINIPGSRPIPPVVMRTPMGDGEGTDGRGAAAAAAEQTGTFARPDAGPERQDEADARPEGAAEDGAATPTSDWFAPRKGSNAPPPGVGMGAGAAAVAGTPGQSPAGQGGGEGRPELPYHPEGQRQTPHSSLGDLDTGAGPRPGAGGNAFTPGGHTPPGGFRPPGDGPNGPTTGPVTGSSPLTTPPSAFTPPGTGHGAPGSGQGPGAFGGGPGGPPRMSDDTAVLTPQVHAPEPSPGGGHVSGDTLTSGIPVVPPEHRSPFPGSAPGAGGPPPGRTAHPDDPAGRGQDADRAMPSFPGGTGTTPAAPGGPSSAPRPKAAAAPAPKKKGRSKLVLLTVALVVVAGGFYGAGLLMNHSAVPKGTTVLGVDIGGGTRDQAVNVLDTRLGKLAATPMELSVGGKTEKLPPDKAGLTLDSQATVRNAAGSDYNPVSVIGSLFGGKRIVEPVIPVDEEKLSVALTDLAGVSGSAREGTIRFEPGKAVAVPGKAGESLDVKRSMLSVQDAYRAQVQTGKVTVVELPVTTRQPVISQAEIDRAMKEFAEPAMSDLVTIQAGGKQIQFGPAKSLPKILSMKAVDGKLVEYYDRKAIDQLLEGVFDGITVTRADGQEHPVNSADVALAMQKALRGKTPAERTQEINLDPS
ncbi:hypothetical protein ACIO1C_30820 [Streptomyces sp. NPDC087420]|uniref:hypothetical protein n=1 Tax=Streptomyces sp. NPDC087420 TaxID=3365785 RepID=UPI0038334B45